MGGFCHLLIVGMEEVLRVARGHALAHLPRCTWVREPTRSGGVRSADARFQGLLANGRLAPGPWPGLECYPSRKSGHVPNHCFLNELQATLGMAGETPSPRGASLRIAG